MLRFGAAPFLRQVVLLTVVLVLFVSASILVAQESPPLTNESIIQVTAWHFRTDEIISVITRNPSHFDLSPKSSQP